MPAIVIYRNRNNEVERRYKEAGEDKEELAWH